MCLAFPVRVVRLLDDEMAEVDIGGIKKMICVALIEAPMVGDFVVMHVGVALHRIDPDQAQKTLELFGEIDAIEHRVSDSEDSDEIR